MLVLVMYEPLRRNDHGYRAERIGGASRRDDGPRGQTKARGRKGKHGRAPRKLAKDPAWQRQPHGRQKSSDKIPCVVGRAA